MAASAYFGDFNGIKRIAVLYIDLNSNGFAACSRSLIQSDRCTLIGASCCIVDANFNRELSVSGNFPLCSECLIAAVIGCNLVIRAVPKSIFNFVPTKEIISRFCNISRERYFGAHFIFAYACSAVPRAAVQIIADTVGNLFEYRLNSSTCIRHCELNGFNRSASLSESNIGRKLPMVEHIVFQRNRVYCNLRACFHYGCCSVLNRADFGTRISAVLRDSFAIVKHQVVFSANDNLLDFYRAFAGLNWRIFFIIKIRHNEIITVFIRACNIRFTVVAEQLRIHIVVKIELTIPVGDAGFQSTAVKCNHLGKIIKGVFFCAVSHSTHIIIIHANDWNPYAAVICHTEVTAVNRQFDMIKVFPLKCRIDIKHRWSIVFITSNNFTVIHYIQIVKILAALITADTHSSAISSNISAHQIHNAGFCIGERILCDNIAAVNC